MIHVGTAGRRGAGDSAALLHGQGGFILQGSSAWRLGELSLFPDRLVFVQPGRSPWALALATVVDLATERRKFIAVQKDVVKLTYVLPGQTRRRLVWFVTANIGRWSDEIATLTKAGRGAAAPSGRLAARAPSAVDGSALASPSCGAEPMIARDDQLEALAATLSPAGVRVLRHLRERGHAGIEELAQVAGVRSHMELLSLLRETINGSAERMFNHPVLEFKERGVDPASRSPVTFQWWLAGAGLRAAPELGSGGAPGGPARAAGAAAAADLEPRGGGGEDAREPLVEVHDEGETLVVVVFGPGVGAETVEASRVQDGDTLELTVARDTGRGVIPVPLPCRVRVVPSAATTANGIASFTLVKETNGEGR